MKLFSSFCLLILLGTASCKKFLETRPQDILSPTTYYPTETHLQSALGGVYDIMGERLSVYKREYLVRMGMEADEGYYKQATLVTGPQVYNYSSTDNQINDFWTSLYSGISRANYLLANVNNNTSISEAVRGQVRGEALFLRAYYYFLLVQTFGGVPLRLTPTTSANETDLPRSTAGEVYEKISADMETAETLVASIKTIGHAGRVSKSAVRGILARVYLYMAGEPLKDVSKYDKAAFWAKKVMDDTETAHALNASYEQVFMNYAQDKYDIKESIWEVEFYGSSAIGEEYGLIGDIIGVPSASATYGIARGMTRTSAKLYQSYEATDVRRDVTIANFNVNTNGTKAAITDSTPKGLYNRHVGKYRREWEIFTPKATNNTPTNWPLLRYSDVLLMYAEAVNETNGPTLQAHNALNLVRARAKATTFTGTSTITSKNAFKDIIIAERSRELAFEALRKPDLIRWGIFLPTMKDMLKRIDTEGPGSFFRLAYANVTNKDILSPIPNSELVLNRAIGQDNQNPGW